jgi:hypothetical protein
MKRSHTFLTTLFLLSCQPSPTPEKLKPVVLSESKPTPTSQAATLTPTSSASLDQTLARGILAGEQVAYSPIQGQVVYTETYEQEGTGSGLNLIFLLKDATERQEEEIYTPNDDAETKRSKATSTLAAKLQTGGYVALTRVEWPEKQAELPLPRGLTFSWKNNVLSAAQRGEGVNVQKHKIKAEKPFNVRPLAVYHAETMPFLLVKLVHDPGSEYAKGFNLFTSYKAIERPLLPSK